MQSGDVIFEILHSVVRVYCEWYFQKRAVLMWGLWAHVLVFVPPQLMLQREFGRAQAVQSPSSLPLSLSPLYLFPPSHLIAFDKCLYWLHIIRCSRGSLRLYYSAHIPHLFSIVHGCGTCSCEVRMGPRLLSVEQLHESQVPSAKEIPGEWVGHGLCRHY